MMETTSECSANQTCIECFGTASLKGVTVSEVGGCEAANISCAAYSAISFVQDEEEYIIANTLGSTTMCQLLSIQCDYVYYEAISSITGQVIYEVEPASCLLIPWWTIPVILIGVLIVVGVTVPIVTYFILQWLHYREIKHFQKEVLEADFTKHVNRAYQSLTMTCKNPLRGKPI